MGGLGKQQLMLERQMGVSVNDSLLRQFCNELSFFKKLYQAG